MHLAAFRRDAGVPGDDGDAAFHRLLQRRNQRVGVVGRDRDGVDLLGDQRVDDLDLAFGGGRGRAGVDHLDLAEFLGGFLRALVGGVEEAVAERLHDQADLDRLGTGGRREHRDGKRCRHHQFLQNAHRISSL